MIKAIMVDIPIEKLGPYAQYVGYLFVGENGAYSVLKTEEDVIKANQWFKCLPKEIHMVSTNGKIEPGDKIFGQATNLDLHEKIFIYLGPTKDGVDICDFRDEKGGLVISTRTFLEGSYKYLGTATDYEKGLIVNHQTLNVDFGVEDVS